MGGDGSNAARVMNRRVNGNSDPHWKTGFCSASALVIRCPSSVFNAACPSAIEV